MKKNKLIPAFLIGALLMTSVTYADNNANSGQSATEPAKGKQVMVVMAKGPGTSFSETQKTTLLSDFEKMIAKQVESGLITKEDGNVLIEHFKMSIGSGVSIPEKLGEKGFFTSKFEDFKNLSLEERKQKIQDDMANMSKKEVAAGVITQAEADKRLEDLKSELANWDGEKPIAFGIKTAMLGEPIDVESIGLEQYKDLTAAQRIEKIVETVKSKLANWDGNSPKVFEIGMPDKLHVSNAIWSKDGNEKDILGINIGGDNMSLDQKKENILKKLTESYNEMVQRSMISQAEADRLIKEVQEKLKNWDGKSPLKFELKSGSNEKSLIIELE